MSHKEYTTQQEQPTVVSEPTVAYGRETYRQDTACTWHDCTDDSHVDYSTMPCIYSDEEFEEVVRQSERRGNATNEEMRATFAKWGAVWQF